MTATDRLPPAPLEDWYRDRYFSAQLDLSGSGVEPYAVADVLRAAGVGPEVLGDVVFRDSHSYGGPALRLAVARHAGRGDPDRVMVTHGSTEALFLTLRALLRSEDDVVVAEPAYHSLGALAGSLAGRVRGWRFGHDGETVAEADVARLVAMVTPGTRAVLLNFPHNPTGAVLDQPSVDRIQQACEQTGAWLLWDAAFELLGWHGEPVRPAPAPRTVVFGTLSKAYGLPGLRVGWLEADPDLLPRLATVRDYTSLALSPVVERIAELALGSSAYLVGTRREAARRNRDMVTAWAAEHSSWISWSPPAGGVCGFPALSRTGDVRAFATALERDHGVLVVPGDCFGDDRRIRLGFGAASTEVHDALHRLGTALERMS